MRNLELAGNRTALHSSIWLKSAAVVLSFLFLVSSAVAQDAGARQAPSSRQTQAARSTGEGEAALNIDLTTASVVGVTPENYREMDAAQLKTELRALRERRERLPRGSVEREALRDVINAIEIQISLGRPPEELIEEITAEVVDLRGLPLHRPVEFKILDRSQLGVFLEKKLAEHLPAEYLPNMEFLMKLLGAIPERADLRRLMMKLLSEQIAGLYDKDTGILYVMKDFDLGRALGRMILAHEICHAIQDQNYHLNSMPLQQFDNDDLTVAAMSVVEGDATILMQEYAASNFGTKEVLELFEMLTMDQSALKSTPHFLREQLTFPYLEGAKFLTRIEQEEPDLRERAFRKPPVSTEQLLHPEKYLPGQEDEPTSASVPEIAPVLGEGWSMLMRNVFGELQIKLLFENWREWNQATTISEGWDGDEFIICRNGDSFVFAWLTIWDSERDAEEFFDGFSKLMRDKRFRRTFGGEKFTGEDGTRILQGEATEDAPHYLHFSHRGERVFVLITNAETVPPKAPEIESQFFAAKAQAPVDAPAERASAGQ